MGRLATAADAPALARIHGAGIADRQATFETEPPAPADVAAVLARQGDRVPTVVVERGGTVVAWASAGPYRERAADAGVAEHSVSVACAARGRGAGRAALYARVGFRVVGVDRRHGRPDGQWRDGVIVEPLRGEAAADPS